MPAGGGYFAVYRSVFQKYEGRPEALTAWLWILAKTRFRSDGDLERGELRVSSRELARQMGWHRSKAQRFIAKLERDGEIRATNRATNRATPAKAFLVVNYDLLQPRREYAEPPTGPPTDPLHKKVEEGKKTNGVAVASKREGGDAVVSDPPATKKKPAARKSRSEQRDYLAEEIRKANE